MDGGCRTIGNGFAPTQPATRRLATTFWEHALRDERDQQNHFDYLHYNPVKHGLVNHVADWPYSSFHRWVEKGAYANHWGSKSQDRAFLCEMQNTRE